MFKEYYLLTKPGIIYGNLLTLTGGFLLASKGHIHAWLLLTTIIGTSLVIGSACAFNNYFDRDIDLHMDRTVNRALVQGTITGQNALIYASCLGLVGAITLAVGTNLLTVVIGLSAFFAYVVLYGIVSKRRSVYGTLIGSISGAAPVVAGYCAVTDRFNLAALILFLILTFWQMPHFYAIAIYRLDDYKRAKIPVLPAVNGIVVTKLHILLYVVAFCIACSLLTIFKYTGYTYLSVMLLLSISWLWFGIRGYSSHDDTKWARKMFHFSLIIIVSLSVMLSIGPLLP